LREFSGVGERRTETERPPRPNPSTGAGREADRRAAGALKEGNDPDDEYLIQRFADNARKKGGEFYTPRTGVRLIVEMLAPKEKMRICDPTAGLGGMLVDCRAVVVERRGPTPATD
jgi:hypothetical protein